MTGAALFLFRQIFFIQRYLVLMRGASEDSLQSVQPLRCNVILNAA